jgi:hypothetical protein
MAHANLSMLDYPRLSTLILSGYFAPPPFGEERVKYHAVQVSQKYFLVSEKEESAEFFLCYPSASTLTTASECYSPTTGTVNFPFPAPRA